MVSHSIHYHIRWSDLKFDWEFFYNREEAEVRAAELVLSEETYTIEQFDDGCPICPQSGLADLMR
jgi:hypothetical protein